MIISTIISVCNEVVELEAVTSYTITAITRCVIFLLLWNQKVSQLHLTSPVSSGYHSQSFIPHQRGFTILHASYSSAGKMPNADTSSPHQSWVYFFVVMMIESAEFLSVFIAVIRSDVCTVPVTCSQWHSTILYNVLLLDWDRGQRFQAYG